MLLLEQVVLPSAQNSHMQEISLTHSLGPKLRAHNVLQALKSMFSPARGYVDLDPSIEKETLTTYPFNQVVVKLLTLSIVFRISETFPTYH